MMDERAKDLRKTACDFAYSCVVTGRVASAEVLTQLGNIGLCSANHNWIPDFEASICAGSGTTLQL